MKKFILVLFFVLMINGCASEVIHSQPKLQPNNWTLVFHHGSDGEPISGSRQALIEAIRAGSDVRVYSKGRRVEHLVNANFLTIFGGEVFAQMDAIRGQKPTLDPLEITLRDNDYVTIMATNDGEKKWFVSQ